jgi:hypothetical protein
MDEIDDAQRDHRQRQNKQETPILGRESALITCFGFLQTGSILPSRVREHLQQALAPCGPSSRLI